MAISAVVLTMNSDRCLDHTLSSLKGFDEVLVCDLESTDRTLDIARLHNARIVTFPRGNSTNNHAARNFAIRAAHCEWVLIVGPDEVVTPQLQEYLYNAIHATLQDDEERPDGIRIPRRNHIFHRFNSATYPDYQLRFFRKELADWQPGKGVQPQVYGRIAKISAARRDLALIHIGRDVTQFMKELNAASTIAAVPNDTINISILSLWWRCTSTFLNYYILDGGMRFGLPGFIRACNMAMEEYVTMTKVYEGRVMPEFYMSLPTYNNTIIKEDDGATHTLHHHAKAEKALEENTSK